MHTDPNCRVAWSLQVSLHHAFYLLEKKRDLYFKWDVVSQNYYLRAVNVWHKEYYRPEEGVLNKVKHREAPPQGPPPYPFYMPFIEKGTLFTYLPVTPSYE